MTEHPVTLYTPESPLRQPAKFVREMFADLLASRELAWRLFIRDLSAQYRNSVLGYVWVFVPPVVASLPFVYLNSTGVLGIGDTPIPYAAYATVGTIIWQTFVDALNSPLRTANAARFHSHPHQFPARGDPALRADAGRLQLSRAARAAGRHIRRVRSRTGRDHAALLRRHAERRADRIHDRPAVDSNRPPLWRRAAQPADCEHLPHAADAGSVSGAGVRSGRRRRRTQSADTSRHDDARLADDGLGPSTWAASSSSAASPSPSCCSAGSPIVWRCRISSHGLAIERPA